MELPLRRDGTAYAMCAVGGLLANNWSQYECDAKEVCHPYELVIDEGGADEWMDG